MPAPLSEYGRFNPNKHTAPNSYHGLNTRCVNSCFIGLHVYRFTAKAARHGMFKNHSVNL